eukprot:366553-Chlamydomonas_euryale.AAC.7
MPTGGSLTALLPPLLFCSALPRDAHRRLPHLPSPPPLVALTPAACFTSRSSRRWSSLVRASAARRSLRAGPAATPMSGSPTCGGRMAGCSTLPTPPRTLRTASAKSLVTQRLKWRATSRDSGAR